MHQFSMKYHFKTIMEETHRISIFNQNVFIEREKAKLKPNNHITNGTDEHERKKKTPIIPLIINCPTTYDGNEIGFS